MLEILPTIRRELDRFAALAGPVPRPGAAVWRDRAASSRHLWHGDLPALDKKLAALPPTVPRPPRPGPVVAVGDDAAAPAAPLLAALTALMPWRKGPFRIDGVLVDSEWRSDLKWARIESALGGLEGQTVLDVGCGNGYFGWRMLGAGAQLVVGIDPGVRFVLQHALIAGLAPTAPNFVLPLALEDLDPGDGGFDSVFSMGVLYHRRDPAAHLDQLASHLAPGGTLVLETLVLPDAARGEHGDCLVPTGRYARMRNVFAVPSLPVLRGWIAQAGFVDIRIADVTVTTSAEQRRTRWIRSQSLSDFLAPDDPSRTVEGLPAPTRAVVIARRPRR